MAKIINTASLNGDLSPDHNHWIYNGLDCCLTFEVLNNLKPMIDNVATATYDFSKALQAPVMEMLLRGILVNQNRRHRVMREMRQHIAYAEENLAALIREGIGWEGKFNWRSPLQVGNLLYDVMGLPVKKKRKADGTYGRSVERDALEALSIYFLAEPIINHVLFLRDLGKSIGFLETEIDSDGRIRTDLQICGTKIGRFSSSVNDFGTGTNLQNVTESLRSVFVADPGYKFCNLDLEQGDSRNVGALCWDLLIDNGDWNEQTAGAYLDACESGDLHTTVTRMCIPSLPWGTAPDREIAETKCYRHFDYRFMSKKLGHGSNYLGTPPTMAKHTKFPVLDVKNFQREYFNAFPCIPAWHDATIAEIINYSMLTTPFGRRRYFFGREREADTHREAIAYVPASMTAEEINLGIIKLWRSDRPVQLLMQVHDSILLQYPEEMEDEIVPWALKEILVPLQLKRGREFVIPSEAQVGWNWGKASPDNPDGLIKWKGEDSRKRTERDFKLSLLGV